MDIEIDKDCHFNHKINRLLVKRDGSLFGIITILSTESIDQLEIDCPHSLITIRTNVTSFKNIMISPSRSIKFYDINYQPLHLPFLEKCQYGQISNCVFYNPKFINIAYGSTFNMTEKAEFIGCIDCEGIITANTVNIINVNKPKHPLDLVIQCDELIVKRNPVHNYKINNGYVKKIRLVAVFEFTNLLETDEVIYDQIVPFESSIKAKKITILPNQIVY